MPVRSASRLLSPLQLRKIPNTSAHYTKARMAMADIYLKHRKDRAAYIKCYMDLAVGVMQSDARLRGGWW